MLLRTISLEFESARLCEGQRKVPGAIMKSLRDALSVPNPMWWRIHERRGVEWAILKSLQS